MMIGIDASRANNSEKTGVEWYAYFVIQGLKKIIPSEARAVLYSREPLRGDLAILPDNWEQKVLKWPPKRLWTQIRLSWEMLINPPDVLFIPAHVFPFIHPKKTAMTVHDIAAIKFPQSYNWFERWYSVWSARYAVKRLWRVITPSQFTKHELIQTFKHLNIKIFDNIFVIPHGYDKKYERKYETNIRQILNKYDIKQPFIMSVGRVEEKKNTWRVIEAFDQIRLRLTAYGLQLVLGGRPGYGYEKVKKAIESSPYKEDIIQPGWVDEADLPYLMNAAEVFVFPSQYEGFGLPILEAFSCGIPVVASRGTALEEIGGQAAIYVEPKNPQAMAEAIVKLIGDRNFREEKIRLGLERVKKFSWEKCAAETLKVLLNSCGYIV